MKLPFYIVSSDATGSILPATCYLYNKYWQPAGGQDFKILGNRAPQGKLPSNFEFIKIKDDNNINKWTKYIYKYIKENEKSDFFVLTLDDYLPNRQLNNNIFDGLLNYARTHAKISRVGLGWSPLQNYKNLEMFPEYTLYQLNQDAPYRLVCQTSIWNREYLLKYFKHRWTPWRLEIRGSWWAKNDGWNIIGAKNDIPFDWIEESALSGRWPNMINVLGLEPEDLRFFIEQGIFRREFLQYGMWTESKVPLFSELGYNFNWNLIKNSMSAHDFYMLQAHYGRLYQSQPQISG